MSCLDTILKSASTEAEWVKQIEGIQNLDLHQLTPAIFHVPEYVRQSKPECYTPQMVGLGPFHHFQFQLRGMTPIKRRFTEQGLRRLGFPSDDIRVFANEVVTPLLPTIRGYYDAHLDVPDPTLAFTLAIDFCFLVELLLSGAGLADRDSDLMNDLVMLENQIPMFLLIDYMTTSGFTAGESLLIFYQQVGRACRQISPLQLTLQQVQRPRDLLEYLYLQIAGKPQVLRRALEADSSTAAATSSELNSPSSSVLQILESIPAGLLLRKLGSERPALEAAHSLKKASQTSAVRWIGSMLGFLEKMGLIDYAEQLMREEPLTPTASELIQGSGVKILGSTAAAGGGLEAAISFDERERILRLPVFRWTPNCEVLMRNLAAYESMARVDEGPGIVTRYLQLMQGLTAGGAKDVKLLREVGVIIIPADHCDVHDVAELLGKIISIRVDSGEGRMGPLPIDSQIEALNQCYNETKSKWKTILSRRWKMIVRRVVQIALMVFWIVLLFFPIASLVASTLSFNIWDCISPWLALLRSLSSMI